MLNVVFCGKKLQWSSNGKENEILFENCIRECLELSDATGMVILFEYNNVREKNTAIIINSDGSVRKKIMVPSEISFLSFYDVYYESDNLAFILITGGSYDIACLFDNDGNYIRYHFTK